MAFQNVNGIRTKNSSLDESLNQTIDTMDQYNISILGISEHHLALGNHNTRRQLADSFQKLRPRRIANQFNSSLENEQGGRLMGGTGIIALDSITGRIDPQGKEGDILGRWSVIHLRRQHRAPVSVITIYQVCKSPTNIIGDTAWHQQRRHLDLHMRHEHPRQAFMTDLTQCIKALQQRNHAIVVGGDWNDWLGSPNSTLLAMCNNLQLVDPWAIKHPNALDFATHEKGQFRIDSVFVSPELQPAIQSIRYTPGGLLCTTDHRAVMIAFHTSVLFGNKITPPIPLQPRAVRSNDKKAVTTFIETMHAHLTQHNAFARSEAMEVEGTICHELAEALDSLIGEAGDLGEKRCRRRRPQWYSTELATTRYTVSLLRHYVNGLRAGIDRSDVIRQRLQRVHVHLYLPTDHEAAKHLLKLHEQRLQDKMVTAETQRRQDLATSAEAAEIKGERSTASAIRAVNKCEQNLRTWKILKFMENKGRTQQLDRLDIPASWPARNESFESTVALEDPKTARHWRTVTDPMEIEHYLLLRNYQHFGQAHGTPFTTPPLSAMVDWTATSYQSTEILTGTYSCLQEHTAFHQNFLKQCHASSALDSIPSPLTMEEFQGKFRVWNERTTTSPSGRHLGRYKALYAHSSHGGTPDAEAMFKEKQAQIASLIVRLMNYCIRTCYPLKRWCKIVNTLIFKDSGNYQVHRLRVIHLFEADLNLLYTVKWRHLVRHAENERLIHPGQYGGRPGYEATSLALLEEMRLDIAYMTRRTMLTFDNDAASCYDRIVVNLASLINRKYGLHQELTKLHGTLLKKTEYRVSTAAGISSVSYSNSPTKPLYGTGQGAGNSPAIWLLISSMLFDTYDTKSHGALFVSPDNQVQVKLGLTGFVDDTNAVVNHFHAQISPPLQQVVPRLQHDAQLWTDLLHMSGGKLELSKCSFHLLQFTFKSDGTPVASQNPQCPDLDLIDPATTEQVKVRLLPSTTPHKILGHWKAPVDPRQNDQLRAIVDKAHNQSLLIAISPLSRQGAWLAYNGKYVACLRYVLPQCWFPPQKLLASENKSMHRIISKCGYARTTPAALLYAPTDYAGAGFLHWHTIQGEGQIKHFVKHWRTDTQLSKMLRITVGWAQWQAGIGISILTDVTTPLPHLECRWLSSLRTFLATINGSIALDIPYTIQLERIGDTHIMDVAIKSGEFNAKDLRYLNYCRLYLHVATLSDLVNVEGTHVMPYMYECERPPWFQEDINVVIQQRPSRFQRHFQWKRFCRMICTDDMQLGPQHQLTEWKQRDCTLRLRREAYLVQGQQPQVYIWRQISYWSAQPHTYLPNQWELLEPSDWTPGLEAEPIDISQWHTPRRCTIRHYAQSITRYGHRSIIGDFQDYLDTLPSWEQTLLSHIQWTKAPFEIMHFLHHQRHPGDHLVVVSDGSSIPTQTMSFGVVIGTREGIQLVEAMGPAFGAPSSHRAECTGCLAGALIIKHIQHYTRMAIPDDLELTIVSDNQSMINSLTARSTYATPYPNSTLAPDWDLLEEIHFTYSSEWRGPRHIEWIRGHQDRVTTLEHLSVEAKYNIQADHLAGEYLVMVDGTPKVTTPIMSQTKCVLYLHMEAIHGQYTTAIRRATSEPPLFKYLSKRHGWSPATSHSIDWESFRQAARHHSFTGTHLLKLVHDKLPTNKQTSRYHKWIKPQCHYCPQTETFDHLCLSTCNPHSIEFRSTMVQSVMTYFQTTNTPIRFQDTFLDAVHMWFSSIDDNEWPQWRGPSSLLTSQRNIGWKQMFRGFLSKQWRTFLTKCFKTEHLEHWYSVNQSPRVADNTIPGDKALDDDYIVIFADPLDSSTCNTKSMKISPILYLAKLIRLIWSHMTQLWSNHLHHIHSDSPISSPAKKQELHNQIRALHSMKPQTLAAHRDRYFFPDIEAYLQRATNSQMQRYVNRYKPVILNSIRQAEKHATNASPLTSFPGFSETATSQRNTPMAQEETPHRKHTRIRPMITQRITKFFPFKPTKTHPP